MLDPGRPIFEQVAEWVEDQIVAGALPGDSRAPSTNELAHFFRINPATAGKGVNLLVERSILVKRRGLGMFVAPGAREALLAERRAAFARNYVAPLLAEAQRIGLTRADVTALIASAETALTGPTDRLQEAAL